MDIHVDIDDELLREFDQLAQTHNITRDAAVRGAIAAWVSQARRDATILELFEPEFLRGNQ
jgi:predicted transcriptional regulator